MTQCAKTIVGFMANVGNVFYLTFTNVFFNFLHVFFTFFNVFYFHLNVYYIYAAHHWQWFACTAIKLQYILFRFIVVLLHA